MMHLREEYDRSLLRVYKDLGQAMTYRQVVDAVRAEIAGMLGYTSVWLQLVRDDHTDLLMLDSGGPVEAGVKALLQDERFRLSRHGEDFLVIPYEGDSLLEEIIGSDDVFVVEDARTHPSSNKDIVSVTGNRTMVCVPLVLAEKTIAALSMGTFFDEGVRVPDAEQLDYVRRLSHHVAVAVDRVRFLGERLDALSQLRDANEELEFRSFLLDSVVDGVIVNDAEDARVLYVNDAISRIVKRSKDELLSGREADWWAQDEREAIQRHTERVLRLGSAVTETHIEVGSGTRIPLEITTSAVVYRGRKALMSVLKDISERRAAQASIEHMALHDPLTGLANRALLNDRIELAIAHARRTGGPLGMIFIDLDHFKTVNDSSGHGVGDMLLLGVAERLKGVVRADDTVARLGGDEFTLVLPGIGTEEDAAKIAEKVLEVIREPILVGEQETQITASLGIALYADANMTADELLRNADLAMYQAKEDGRNSWRMYDPAMNETASQRFVLKNDLRYALERGEMQLHYQPQVALEDGSIVGAEALLRWTHPVHGAVSPVAFIPLAEETGAVIEIGHWVLAQACAQARRWQDEGLGAIPVSVNLSPRQLSDGELTGAVCSALEDSGLDPSLLVLEITETVALRDAPLLVGVLDELRRLGVRTAIDDFGTGYSSLAYLKQFPVDALKIDRAFVKDVSEDRGSAAIATAIVSLACALDLAVIAEGVETEDQRRTLLSAGCVHAQGFLYSPAVPGSEFEGLVARSSAGWSMEPGPLR